MDNDEIVAQTRNWLEKAVIGLNLCPFAKAVYVKSQVRFVVSSATNLDRLLEDLDEELDFLAAADPQQVDTTLLIHPKVLNDFLDFNDFLEVVDTVVAEHDLEGVLQVASFHPHYQFEGTEPTAMSNYSNRAPFPILHLLRESSIARAVEAFPNADSIYERNIEVLEKLGFEGWKKMGLDL